MQTQLQSPWILELTRNQGADERYRPDMHDCTPQKHRQLQRRTEKHFKKKK